MLGDSTRIRILLLLIEREQDACVGSLAEQLGDEYDTRLWRFAKHYVAEDCKLEYDKD